MTGEMVKKGNFSESKPKSNMILQYYYRFDDEDNLGQYCLTFTFCPGSIDKEPFIFTYVRCSTKLLENIDV